MLRILLAIAAVYLLVVGLAWVFQAKLLYQPGVPTRAVESTPSAIGADYESLTLETSDGFSLHGWLVTRPSPRATALFMHGNAGNISHRLDSIAQLLELGLNVLIIDYRGYGRSEGTPSETGTALDARAAWQYLTLERDIPSDEIVVFGRSLGAAVAAELAQAYRPGAVILESPFKSIPAIAQDVYPFLPARWLSRIEYPTVRHVREIEAPLLVIHSRDDEIIPFGHGRAVFEAARAPKRFLEIEGGHNTGFMDSRERYIRGIDAFLTDVAGLRE